MTTIFVIGDTHFGHSSILTFKRNYDPSLPIRAFGSVEEMDEHLIERWNEVVRPQDHVYHLGDVALRDKGLEIVKRLNGHKRLVRGNHDIFKTKHYLRVGFEEIHGVRVINNMVLTHTPIHPINMKHRWLCNIHGHLHNNLSPTSFTPELGPKYFNASCEVLAYRPITLEEVVKEVKGWENLEDTLSL